MALAHLAISPPTHHHLILISAGAGPYTAGHQSPRHLQDADVLLLRCPSSVAVVMQPITYLITVYKYSKQKH